MSNRRDKLVAGRVCDRDELAVFARIFLLGMLVTRWSVGLGQAVGYALHAGAKHRQ